MKSIFTIVFLVFCTTTYGQDITGIWRGSFSNILYQRSDGDNKRIPILTDQYKFEVQIAQSGNKFDGVTYSYLTTVFYGKATARGTVNKKNGKVFLEELKLVEVRMSSGAGACAMTLFMQYSKSGDEEFLEGTYTAINISDSSRCPGGKVFLRKVPTSDFYKEPMVINREKEIEREKKRKLATRKDTTTRSNPIVRNTPPKEDTKITPKTSTPPKNKAVAKSKPPKQTGKDEVKTINPSVTTPRIDKSITKLDSAKKIERKTTPVNIPRVLSTRDNELVKTITTDRNEIVVKLYDNGTIDNDTVSVFLDNKLVISKQRLTEKAIILTIKLDESENEHELIMVAENLGEIPPNTSLMVVDAGSKQYEVRITSTEQKNAMVVFKYVKSN